MIVQTASAAASNRNGSPMLVMVGCYLVWWFLRERWRSFHLFLLVDLSTEDTIGEMIGLAVVQQIFWKHLSEGGHVGSIPESCRRKKELQW